MAKRSSRSSSTGTTRKSKASGAAGPNFVRQVIVINNAWVLVGDVVRGNNELVVSNASVIRLWGTSAGLGELVAKGPTGSTKLDPLNGTVRIPMSSVIYTIDVPHKTSAAGSAHPGLNGWTI